MKIELYNNHKPEWDAYVKKSGKAMLYHLAGWKSVIEETYGHKPFYLMAKDNGNVKGVLPLFLISSKLFGVYIVSLPFHCIGGVCTDNEEAERLLIEEAIKITKETNAEYLELRQSEKVTIPGLYLKNHKVTFILQLDTNPDVVWKNRFSSDLRNKIRKASKLNIKVLSGIDKIYLDQFYNIFANNMRDLGTPVLSKKLMENIVKEFPVESRIFIANYNGRPIGGQFLMFFKDTAYLIWTSSLRKYFKIAPSNLLLNWEAIQYYCRNGIQFYDFGRSSINEEKCRFKRQFGGEMKPLYWQYYLNKRTEIPDLSLGNEKFKMAIHIWKKLPVSVTKFVGPKVVKYIP